MFRQLLQQLVQRIDGAEAAFVVGLDGLVVECFSRTDAEAYEQLGAECSALVKTSVGAAGVLPGGPLEEITLVAGSSRLILRLLIEGYFAGILLSGAGNLGLARFELRKLQFELDKELAL